MLELGESCEDAARQTTIGRCGVHLRASTGKTSQPCSAVTEILCGRYQIAEIAASRSNLQTTAVFPGYGALRRAIRPRRV